MKQGIVKFSKEFVTATGLKEWIGVEYPVDFENEDVMQEFKRAKDYVHSFHVSGNIAPTQIGPSTELPVINKAEERLGILIENASTKEELMGYKDDCSTVYLADLWATKLALVNKKQQ